MRWGEAQALLQISSSILSAYISRLPFASSGGFVRKKRLFNAENPYPEMTNLDLLKAWNAHAVAVFNSEREALLVAEIKRRSLEPFCGMGNDTR